MQQRNQRPALLPMAAPYETLPADPYVGMSVTHTSSKLALVWTGTAWSCLTSGVVVYPNPGSIPVRRSVTQVSGALVLTNPATHDRSDGVVLHLLSDDWLAVAQSAEVDGFTGLTAQAPLYVAAGGTGALTHDPDDTKTIIPVGAALTTTTIQARLGFGSG